MERLKFEPLSEAETNFFGCLEQYFFADRPDKEIQNLAPMETVLKDDAWYYNFLDKIVKIDNNGKAWYAALSDEVVVREVTYNEMEAIRYAIEEDCHYGLYDSKEYVFSFCGSRARIGNIKF